VDFTAFVLSQLPSAPARVLEIGCGPDGGITPALVAAGYDAVGVDPHAPAGARFRATRLEELDGESYDAVVGERVLHHVHPLGRALDTLARLAPLLVLEEFAWEQMDDPTRDWYESHHRALRAAGVEPKGPPDWARWEAEFLDGLHPSRLLRDELRERYDERLFELRPYLYRWLAGPATLALEEGLLAAGAIKPIGCRWVGVSRSTARPG
jgi:SAM-dependent methyltransferase